MLFLMLACTRTDPDAALLDTVQDAATARLSLTEAHATIQAPTFIHTITPQARDKLQLADIANDPAHAPLPDDFRSADALIFWERPLQKPNPMLVGLLWDTSDTPTIIYGELLPP